jgi:hypothetical protein
MFRHLRRFVRNWRELMSRKKVYFRETEVTAYQVRDYLRRALKRKLGLELGLE